VGRFRRTRKGIELRLDRAEAALVQQLVAELTALLAEPGSAGADSGGGLARSAEDPWDFLARLGALDPPPPVPPSDPVLARLLPDGYRDDPVAAAELRRYTEPELRRGKLAAAATVLETLDAESGRLLLDEPAAEAWLGVLNDLRLAVGTRLDVSEETYAELDRVPADSPRGAALGVFGWLGWLQETLVEALSFG
jgi:hypothetical protein